MLLTRKTKTTMTVTKKEGDESIKYLPACLRISDSLIFETQYTAIFSAFLYILYFQMTLMYIMLLS